MCVCVGRREGRGEPDGCPRPSRAKALRSAAPESGVLSVNGGRRPTCQAGVPSAPGSGAPGDPRPGGRQRRGREGVRGPQPAPRPGAALCRGSGGGRGVSSEEPGRDDSGLRARRGRTRPASPGTFRGEGVGLRGALGADKARPGLIIASRALGRGRPGPAAAGGRPREK